MSLKKTKESSEKPLSKTNMNPQKIAEDWKSRGFSFGVFTDPPGQVWSDLIHQTEERLMLVKGELELEMQGRTLCCGIGEEVTIPAKTSHTVRNTGKITNRWFFGYKRT